MSMCAKYYFAAKIATQNLTLICYFTVKNIQFAYSLNIMFDTR